MTPLHAAQKIVLDATPTLGLEKISILDSLGRVLGEDIVAERDNPPWDNSAMDGFAVRWEDIKQEHAIGRPVMLTVIEDVPDHRRKGLFRTHETEAVYQRVVSNLDHRAA